MGRFLATNLIHLIDILLFMLSVSSSGSLGNYFSSIQFSCSVVSNCLRPHESQHARPPCPSPTPGVHSVTSIESVMPSSHFILCRPLLLLPLIPPRIRVFSNELTLRMRWPKYWSFSFSIIPSKEVPVLISFRMDWNELNWTDGVSRSQTPLSDWTELSLSLQQPHMNQET